MDNEQNQNKNSRIIDVDLQNEMRKSFLDYSMSVIVSRALPDVRDGLKPVHRRILYTMNQIGLDPSKPYHKCADTVGQVLGSYHPHGDASVYDAMVRLAQDFSMRFMSWCTGGLSRALAPDGCISGKMCFGLYRGIWLSVRDRTP